MQHLDGIGQFRQVYHPGRGRFIPYPNFLDALADYTHGLPVIRFPAAPQLVHLEPGFPTGIAGKGSQSLKRVAKELDRPDRHE